MWAGVGLQDGREPQRKDTHTTKLEEKSVGGSGKE